LAQIRAQIESAQKFAEEKVALASQTYEMLDKHIRRLDTDLGKFQTELQRQARLANGHMTPADKKKKNAYAPPSGLLQSAAGQPQFFSTWQSQQAAAAAAIAAVSSSGLGGMVGNNYRRFDQDMPVDPNEPTYCICHRVSFGEMVCCDSSDCPTQWFHFECVGLTSSPKGKWFCADCRGKKGRFAT
jgi:hypothetical protein